MKINNLKRQLTVRIVRLKAVGEILASNRHTTPISFAIQFEHNPYRRIIVC